MDDEKRRLPNTCPLCDGTGRAYEEALIDRSVEDHGNGQAQVLGELVRWAQWRRDDFATHDTAHKLLELLISGKWLEEWNNEW